MPSQQEVRWSQLKVGLIVLLSSVLLVILLLLIANSEGISLFSHKLRVSTYFANAAGLKDGAAVNLDGFTIGTVKSVDIVSDPKRQLAPVQVVMQMDEKYAKSGRIRKDSLAGLSTVGVLGDTVVDINSLTASGPPIQNGDEMKTLESENLTDVIKASQGTVESLNVILSKMNAIVDNMQSGKGSVGLLLNDPSLYNRFLATTNQLNDFAANLNSDRSSIGKLMNDNGKFYDHVDDTITKVDSLATDLQAGKGTIGILLKDPTLANNLNATLVRANTLLAEADSDKGSVGMLLKDPTFATNLNHTLEKVTDLVTKIDDGKGSVGKFVNDDAFYNNADKLMTDSSDLVTTIRKDPKKYLTIHMKIF